MTVTRRDCDVLIVGAGHAGAQAAIALRQQRFDGVIEVVGAEPDFPYERPALSKEYLSGEKSFERIQLRPTDFWSERGIRMTLGRRVIGIDADAREAELEGGDRVRYGSLIWAAGGTARRLACAGADADGVHAIRDRADADALASELRDGSRVVIVGGGYIGLEAAAVLAMRGISPTLLEAQDRLLARVAGATISSFYEAEHRSRGVDIRLGARVDFIEVADGRANAVRLSDGERIEADVVIVGVGIQPSTVELESAGAEIADGVVVDSYCRTSLPSVFAIGDCASHPNPYAGGRLIRLESVQNANDQASLVAKALCGDAKPYDAVPWFWSNQYDLKLQTLGLSQGHDQIVLRGSIGDRSFSVVYLCGGRIVAIDCVNAVRDYVQAKAWIANGDRPNLHVLADAATPLKLVPVAD